MDLDGSTCGSHRYCLTCGYILDGLPEARCPECGRGFDPADPETFAVRVRSGAATLAISLIGGLAFASGMLLSYLDRMGIVQVKARGPVLGILIPVGALSCILVAAIAYDGLFGRHTAIRDRSRLHLAIAIAAAVTLWGTVHTALVLAPLAVN
jgi:hypothetical protein